MLQKNIWTGILFLIGITASSWKMGLATLLATVVGTGTAIFLRFNQQEIKSGIYGFSAALVGAAGLFFFESTLIIWTLVLLGAIIATILQHFFIQLKIPAYTLPFVLVTWLFLYLIPAEYHVEMIATSVSAPRIFEFIFTNYGQVIFQNQLWIGVLFFMAVAISTPRAAIFGAIGGIIASIIFYLSWTTFNDISTGLYGFNAVLCAITFAGKKMIDIFWAFIAVIISIAISLIFIHYNFPQLTFPFVVGAGMVTLMKALTFSKSVN